ncbi:hypothetical protein Tco_0345971, partial [Tanacetum coccineum]
RRKSGKVTSDPPKKLKGIPSLTPEKQEAANIMQALKESKKTSKRQPGTKGSNKGTGTKPGIPNKENHITEENVILEWGSEQENTGDEDNETESDEEDIYNYKICVRKDENEEMLNAKAKDSRKCDEEVTNAAKADAKKTEEAKDDS